MADEEVLEELQSRWERERALGRELSPADLCRDRPELAPELQRRIQAVRRVDALAGPDPDTPASPPPGRTGGLPSVPGYEVLCELGRGGMGVVYKARQTALGRVVALKMILAGPYASAAERERFRREAAAVARLLHPNVVQVYEVGEAGGRPFVALEWVAGGSLDGRLGGALLPPRAAAELVESLAHGVGHAHAQGIVHRDLKPANVLLAPRPGAGEEGPPKDPEVLAPTLLDGVAPPPDREAANGASAPAAGFRASDFQPKVTDFGLAKQLDDVGQTPSGAVLGTPSYMAPEQAAGRTREVGPAADVYALGAILYECLTGRPPFRGITLLDTLEQVRTREPVPPSRLQPKVPRDLETVCSKCLQKDPSRRYPGAAELAEDLRRFLAHEPIRARPVGAAERLAKWARRRPAVAGLLALTAAAVLLGLAGVLWQWWRAEDALGRESEARRLAERAAEAEQAQRRRAEEAFDQERAKLYLHRVALAERDLAANNADHAAQTLDACPEALRHWEWHYLRRLCRPELLTLRGGESVSDVAFSPDRRLLACATSAGGGRDATGEVRLWDVTDGRLVRRYTGHPDWVREVAFHPDGRRVASRSLMGLVKVWDAATGADLRAFDRRREGGTEFTPARLAWSADGSRLALACTITTNIRPGVAPDYQGSEVLLWDVAADREASRFRTRLSEVSGLAFSPDGRQLAATGRHHRSRFVVAWEVQVWDAATGAVRHTLPGRICVAFRPDGKQVAAAGLDETVRAWDTADGREAFVCRGHKDFVAAVAYSPDGKWLASAGRDRSVKLWDPRTGREAFTLPADPTGAVALAFHPDGRRLASCGYSADVRVWDVSQPPGVVALPVAASHARGVSFDGAGRRLAFAQTDQSIEVGGPIGGSGDVRRAGPSPEAVTVHDLAAGRDVLTLKGRAWAAAFSPDGGRLAAASLTNVRLWDARTGALVGVLPGREGMVTALAFRPDGGRLLSANGGAVRVWDVAAGTEVLGPLAVAPGSVWSVAWSGDGRLLAAACLDKKVRVWEADTGRPRLTFGGHTASVMAVAFSPDGGRAASAGWDNAVRVWEADTGRELFTLTGHSAAVLCLAFSADGRRLVSGGKDRSVKLWDLGTGQEALTLRGHTDQVNGVAFSRDGRLIASAGEDGQVRIWGAAPPPPF